MNIQHILTGAAFALTTLATPQLSAATIDETISGSLLFGIDMPATTISKDETFMGKRGRGRGRGRGGDDDRSDDRSNSGRDKPRIPGGSGCDDPGDILEHPECRI